jgi:acetyl esterase/lipase
MSEHPALILETGIAYGTGGGRSLELDMLRPDVPLHPERPAVIWVHGGGWRGGERAPSPNWMFASLGFVTASISYRFSDEAIFPAQIHDVKAAIRFLRANTERWGIDPERIGVWGGSAGGHLSALAAVSDGIPELEGEGGNANESSAVQAAIPLAPPTDFLADWNEQSAFPPHPEVEDVIPALLGGDDREDPVVAERARLASPLHLVHANVPPVLVVHGTLDDLVPVAQGRTFVDALLERGADASILELPHDGHDLGSVFEAPEGVITPARQQILDFFVRELGPVDRP